MNKPDFIIVGSARCGTTSLFQYLAQHPGLKPSRIKEPKFFTYNFYENLRGPGDETTAFGLVKNEQDYGQLWGKSKATGLCYEGSSDYLYYFNSAIPKIKAYCGDPKIIISLRDPSARAFSCFMNHVRDNRESLEFAEALKEEKARIEANYGWMWHYAEGGKYYEAVKAYFDNFTNVCVLSFEDFERNPQEVLDHLTSFLNVDPFVFDIRTRYSQSGTPRNSVIRLLSSRTSMFAPLRSIVIRCLPRPLLQTISSNWFAPEPFDSSQRDLLVEWFREDQEKLQIFLAGAQQDISGESLRS